jgi:hypothetical protein
VALDDLFAAARQHTAAAQYATHALPFEVFMLAMLLEEHKQVLRLRQRVAALELTGPGEKRRIPPGRSFPCQPVRVCRSRVRAGRLPGGRTGRRMNRLAARGKHVRLAPIAS